MPGFVFYDGPSMLDGAPIIGIAVTSKSRNGKTGEMIQTYILRADIDPVTALRIGADASICGDCVHRPANGGSCYVDVPKSVLAIYAAWSRGGYHLASPRTVGRALAGRVVRIGSYGDPAAIPAAHWRAIIRHAAGHTGYSHQWRLALAQGLRGIVMASADSAQDRDVARASLDFAVDVERGQKGQAHVHRHHLPQGIERRALVFARQVGPGFRADR